jgi:hypothetical protein
MARHTRKFTPRQRTKRPLGVSMTSNAPPKIPHSPPVLTDLGWHLSAPLSSRLFQKSGIGFLLEDEGIILSPMEILFCNWHRHVPLPSPDWFENEVDKDRNLLAKAIIFDAARSGGEVAIPIDQVRNHKINKKSFALKWKRNQSHFKSEPESHIRWFWTFETLDWRDIFEWSLEVESLGCKSDIFVIDEEMEVTMYRVSFIQPSGEQRTWNDFSDEEQELIRDMWSSKIETKSGYHLPMKGVWPWNSLGVEHISGINLRSEESDWLTNLLEGKSNKSELQLFDYLINNGLILRPGFKYGCKWRVYDDEVSNSHAPWLLQPEEDVARTWENACLSIRLAEGVHKKWVCAIKVDESWRFMQVERWSAGRD